LGENTFGPINVPANLGKVFALSLTDKCTCAREETESITCFGYVSEYKFDIDFF
jgi:hypothetical protein